MLIFFVSLAYAFPDPPYNMHDELSGGNGSGNFFWAMIVAAVLFLVVAGVFWLVTPKAKP